MNSPIPHVIYFFWDRGKVLPDFAKKNIASWHKFFPDYLIREIDSTNFDINSVKVVRLAYEQKRFSYACDYIRLKWIYDHGGIYFDLDVEVIKDMRDIVDRGPFFGIEGTEVGKCSINTGSGFACEAGNPLLKSLMKSYEDWNGSSFIDERGFPALQPCPVVNWPVFAKFGVKPNNELQVIQGITFYPSDFFCPMDMHTRVVALTNNTRSIHAYTGRGQTEIDRWVARYRSKILAARKGRPLDERLFTCRMRFFHPIRAIRYHKAHKVFPHE